MLPHSTDGWALRLHSCRALSSQPQVYPTPKGENFEAFPLTNHIPVHSWLRSLFSGLSFRLSMILSVLPVFGFPLRSLVHSCSFVSIRVKVPLPSIVLSSVYDSGFPLRSSVRPSLKICA